MSLPAPRALLRRIHRPLGWTANHHWFALLAPPGRFYRDLLRSLKNGFAARGYACVAYAGDFSRDRLAAWVDRHGPTAVLEINWPLGSGEPWPKKCVHLAWIQDYRFNGRDLTKSIADASDHLYFLLPPEQFALSLVARSWSILLPGVKPWGGIGRSTSYEFDFSLCGFIPPPLDPRGLVSVGPDGRPIVLEEFLRHYPKDMLFQSKLSPKLVRWALDATCDRIGCERITAEEVVQVFDHILPRIHDRRRLLEAALSLSPSLAVYGPRSWIEWPRFAPYWRGYIEDPAVLDQVYQSTRVNLHNSTISFHPRLAECLAAGGFIMTHSSPYDFGLVGIRNHLEPDKHYGVYDISNIEAAARRYLEDEPHRRAIAAEGQRAVLAAHTWPHRAAQILRDLGLPPEARRKGDAFGARLRDAAEDLACPVRESAFAG